MDRPNKNLEDMLESKVKSECDQINDITVVMFVGFMQFNSDSCPALSVAYILCIFILYRSHKLSDTEKMKF